MVPARNGCKPLRPDWRDKRFSHSKKFGSASVATLPTYGLGRVPLKINDQNPGGVSTQYCTAAGTSSAAEYEQNRKFSFEFQVAAIGRMSGAPILDGADPRMALKARVAYGSLPDELTPDYLRLSNMNTMSIAQWSNWPNDLWNAARKYVAGGFFWLDSSNTPFDMVREALWNARVENEPVVAFGKWFSAWNAVGPDGFIPKTTDGQYTLHCYDIIDWTQVGGIDYLIIQNSVGSGYGKNGTQLIDRKTFDAAWPFSYGDGTGMAIYRKANPDDIDALKQQWLSLLDIWASLVSSLLFRMRYGFGR